MVLATKIKIIQNSQNRTMKTQIHELRTRIDGFEFYEVDRNGNVYSLNRMVKGRNCMRNTGNRILRPTKDKDGYLYVVLQENGKITTKKIHRIVGETFIPNPNNLPQLNHIDGIKIHNYPENLEWCTSSENIQHSYNANLKHITTKQKTLASIRHRGEGSSTAKLTEIQVLEIKRRALSGEKQITLSREFNVTDTSINYIIKGKTWKHLI